MKNTLTAMAVTLALSCTPAYAQENTVEIRFDGDSFDPPSSDLFQGKGSLSPGDTLSTRITLVNDSDAAHTFYLTMDSPTHVSSREQVFMEAATVTLETGRGSLLYDGPLAARGIYEPFELGTCEPQGQVELLVDVVVPGELGNEFAMSNGVLHWRFWAAPEEPDVVPNVFETLHGLSYDRTGLILFPASLAGLALTVVGIGSFAIGRYAKKRK